MYRLYGDLSSVTALRTGGGGIDRNRVAASVGMGWRNQSESGGGLRRNTHLAVKEKANGTRYAVTDAGRLSVTFPTDFEYHETFVANKPYAPLTIGYHVMGRICTSADWMFKNRLLPELVSGDILAVMDAGAYFSSYSTNFAFPRPPIVMVSENHVDLLRRGDTFEHLTAMDHI